MTRAKIDNRPTIQIKQGSYLHTLIAQDDQRNKQKYPGAYLGHTGFVLKRIDRIVNSKL